MHTGLKIVPIVIATAVLAVLAFSFGPSPSAGAASRVGFGFNGQLSGFPTGAVTLTGGGAYDPQSPGASSFVHSGGGFSCTADVNQSFLTGCLAGEGVRWDTVEVLPSFS